MNKKVSVIAKICTVDRKYHVGLQRHEVKKVAAKLKNEDYSTEKEWLAAVKSSVNMIRNDPLHDNIVANEVAFSKLCPICNKVGHEISLMRGRTAYYCKIHKVVSPAIAQV